MWLGLITPPDDGAPRRESHDPFRDWAAGTLGMAILLVTLGVLFAASIVLYLVIRLSAGAPPVALPPLPRSLWLSTALIVVSSVTIQLARGAARRGQGGLLRGGLVLTLLLGAAFLVCQVVSWQPMIEVYRTLLNADPPRPFYVGSFFLLTGLHGAHVLGGLVPLGIITARAFAGRYTPQAHAGVAYTTMYWHFLDVVWVVLFAVLLIVR
jgi:cytochrome c oxidase subunit 3